MQSVEQIVALYNARREAQGPILLRMREVRDLANGDIVIPLSELDRNARTNVANLLVQGLDQTSMRIASTMPMPFFPPMKQGNADSQEMARLRKKIILSYSYKDQNFKTNKIIKMNGTL